ncbi:hypothetical protein BsWGS_08633 [Bradybaena similaris]
MGKVEHRSKGHNKETAFTETRQARGQVTEDTRLHGEYDPRHRGPNKDRSCTDVICCLIFLVFLAGLGVVAGFAFYHGDPRLLVYPQDSNGNLCGYGTREDRKYLFFFDISVCGRIGPGVFVNGCPTPQVCVKDCPTTDYVYPLVNKPDLLCKEDVDLKTTPKDIHDLVVKDEQCAFYAFESKAVINRCLPISHVLDLAAGVITIDNVTLPDSGAIKEGIDFLKTFLNAKEFGDKIIADVTASWWMILVGLVVAMVISLIWITLMRFIAGFMVWLTVLAFVAVWIGLAGASWYLYYINRGSHETMTVYLVWRLTFEKENLFLAGGIIFGVIMVVVLLILLVLCSRIRIAVALIKQSSKAVGAMWSTLFWPVFPFILQIAVVALWGSVATFLASVGRNGDPGANNLTTADGNLSYDAIKEKTNDLLEKIPCDVNSSVTGGFCGFIKYGKGDWTIYLQVYNLFMLFWLVNFVAALGHLTLSGAFSSWYWAFDKHKDVPALPLLGAFGRCFRYHLGTLAFGSLLIAIVQLIRACLEYLDHKMKGSQNPVAKFFIKCLKCCFWCLEKILKFICKNAYIMVALSGRNFCSSARRAFSLILKNCVRAFVLDKVTDFLMFVCKLLVVGLVGFVAYFFFDGRISFLNDYKPQLNFYLVPIIIVIIGSYIVADIFFSVYEMAVDTIFLCFLEDIERNDGSPEKPYFMGKGLMKLLGKSNVKVKGK